MTGASRYLIDKSALARMTLGPVRARLVPMIESGGAATCSIVDLEVLFSTRNFEDHLETRVRRSLAYRLIPLSQAIFDRAVQVQGELARTGRHRLPIPDLVIAATAESAGLSVMHYDADYDRIAEVTGQPTEWVVPRGSL